MHPQNTVLRGHAQDRAAVVATAIIRIFSDGVLAWFGGEISTLAGLRAAIEEILRDEFSDIQRMTRDEIRESE